MTSRIASAIATSTAAIVNMNKTKIWPTISVGNKNLEKATKDKFIPLSISSIDIKIITTFLFESDPSNPMLKRAADNIK